ncbi:MAG: urease accessory protein UreD [bacterium]|nr:urease accessory protein UreD [bacterium]
MENHFVKTSKLMIEADVKEGKTVLKDVYFTAPFKIMNPFYMNKDYMTVMCMSSSAGIMAGDVQEYHLKVKEGAKLEFVSQEYEKIHKMNEGFATRATEISVAKNGLLLYNPQPTIPFKNSAFKSKVNVHLEDDTSTFVMKEIISAGRVSRGELFEYQYYHNLVNVYRKDTLIYRDNTRFEPTLMDLSSMGLFEHYTHMGTLLLFSTGHTKEWLHDARNLIEETPDIDGGVTTLNETAIVIRVLGFQADKLEKLMDKILMM